MNSKSNSLRVGIIGGSIGGLCAGVSLRRIGCDVSIYERTSGAMNSRGAGIVVQNELSSLLETNSAPPLPTTGCSHRVILQPGGGSGASQRMPQRFTSWQAIHRTLAVTFGNEQYHSGSSVSGFDLSEGLATLNFENQSSVQKDLLIGADGVRSATRRHLLPDIKPEYAGYIAWRGTLLEQDAPPGLASFFAERFTFCEARSGGHILAYLIPGDNADTTPGRRRLNWVWYVDAPDSKDVDSLLTDRTGRIHSLGLSAGRVTDDKVAQIHSRASAEVHPKFAELVQATPDPFIQSIIDIAVPQMVFGRACLLGDAAFIVRPHTAAGTAKAAADAGSLADAIQANSTLDEALAQWQSRQIQLGQSLSHYGISLGRR